MYDAEDELNTIIRTEFYRDGVIPAKVDVNRALFFQLWEQRAFERIENVLKTNGGSFNLYYYRGIRIYIGADL